MSGLLRVLDTGLRPARWNIAMSAVLAELHCTGAIPDTLRFHRYPRSVLLGSHQSARREVRAKYCQRKKVEVARRVTGGGTVYMCPSILAWDLVIERRHFGLRLGDAMEFMGVALAAGLARLGLPARFMAPDEITIDGRRNTGLTAEFDESSLVMQGVIRIDSDPNEIADALKATAAAEKRQPIVASLSEFFGRVPPLEEIKAVLVAQLSHTLRRDVVSGIVGVEEAALTERLLAEEIGTDTFVMGDIRNGKAAALCREMHAP